MTTPAQMVSRDAKVALNEFDRSFMMALAAGNVPQWAKQLGKAKTTRALVTTYPIPVSAIAYKRHEGDIRYESLFQKSISLIPETWVAGVAELADIVEAPDFIGWEEKPAEFALAAAALENKLVAAVLAAGDSTVLSWDDEHFFFDTGHRFNILDDASDTFDNVFSGAGTDLTAANLKVADQRFRAMKLPNGDSAGLRLTHVLSPSGSVWAAKQALEQDNIIQAIGSAFGPVQNMLKGYASWAEGAELAGTAWYALALNRPGMFPWIIQDDGAPELLQLDKSSALYERELKVGIRGKRRAVAGPGLPQCIQKYAGTAPAP